jgi:serpin B
VDADGLADVENRIGHDYDAWVAALANRRVDLWLPRWKETQTFVLDAILKVLGMPLPFTRDADFSGMTDMPTQDPGKFYIGTVIQKAFVDADEFGTEAAAATAVVMMVPMSAVIGAPPEPPPVVFHADHPFLYVIRERKTGAVLFVGRVVDPR